MGVRADRLHIVPVGVDPEIFHPMPEVARVPGRLMTTTSSDVPMKGLVPLLEALGKVRAERNDVELVIIGKPKDKSRIPPLIERLGLADSVRFVSGVPTERIVELYAEAEVAVVPSLYEGFSLPAIEAMACGVPLVATTGGALPEVVGADGETGLLVPPGDPDALAHALLRALGDANLRARIGAAGRARALERFTWRATAIGTVENYRALLDERAGVARSA
jgi:glycosyltransferase involved in cell wall biosynthesis